MRYFRMTRIQDYHDHYEWLSSYSWNDDPELLSRRQRKAQLKASRDGVRMRGPKKTAPSFVIHTNGGWSYKGNMGELYMSEVFAIARRQGLWFAFQ